MSATQNPTPTASIHHAPTAPVTLPEDSLPPAKLDSAEQEDVRQEDAAESQPASPATCSVSPMDLDSNDAVAEAKAVAATAAELQAEAAPAVEVAQDWSSPKRTLVHPSFQADKHLSNLSDKFI